MRTLPSIRAIAVVGVPFPSVCTYRFTRKPKDPLPFLSHLEIVPLPVVTILLIMVPTVFALEMDLTPPVPIQLVGIILRLNMVPKIPPVELWSTPPVVSRPTTLLSELRSKSTPLGRARELPSTPTSLFTT